MNEFSKQNDSIEFIWYLLKIIYKDEHSLNNINLYFTFQKKVKRLNDQ